MDADGKRIKTDILCRRYIHESLDRYNIVIPDEIIGVIFMFWLIDICDEWDQSLCHKLVDIDGAVFKIKQGFWRQKMDFIVLQHLVLILLRMECLNGE